MPGKIQNQVFRLSRRIALANDARSIIRKLIAKRVALAAGDFEVEHQVFDVEPKLRECVLHECYRPRSVRAAFRREMVFLHNEGNAASPRENRCLSTAGVVRTRTDGKAVEAEPSAVWFAAC